MGIVLGLLIAFVIFYFISIYNRLVRLKNQCENAYSQIDVQLQRRYELIPNLIEVAKKVMSHEKETLEAVINARNIAFNKSKDPSQMMEAEKGLTAALGSFFALSENYPDLKANENMKELMEELTTTDNRVAFAKQGYNDRVTEYNITIDEFPDNIVAKKYKFQKNILLEIEDVKMRLAPKVKF